MTPQQLAQFPSLAAAYSAIGNLPPLQTSYMATALYPGYPHFHDIPTVDAALGVLLPRFSPAVLTAQIRDAFGATEGKWQAAMTELLAFSRLQQDGQLDCIGWPPSAPGTTPPFEGRLLDVNATNQPIAFDVKNASNVGLRLLEDALFPVVTAWCSANGLPQAEIEFDTSGPVTQVILGPAKTAMVAKFQNSLFVFNAFPPTPIQLTVGNTTIRVSLRAATGSSMNVSVTSVLARANSVRNVVRGHVIGKAAQAAKHNGEFIIVYVRPPNSGTADVKPKDLELLLPALDTDPTLAAMPGIDRWLGVVMFDWTPSPAAPNRHGLLRNSAKWPSSSSPITLASTLALTPWP
jgi:hypothetical protein